MKRYLRDPNAPSHLRKLVESASTDGLDVERRRRVAERLGLTLPAALQTPTSPGAPSATVSWPAIGAIALAMTAIAGGSVGYTRYAESRPTATAPVVPGSSADAPEVPAPVEKDSVGTMKVSALPDVPAHRPADLPARRPADLPARRLADLPAHRPADLPAHRPDLPAHRPADLPAERTADVPAERTVTAARPAAPEAKQASRDLRLEIEALDGVRRTTEAGRPRDALALLDQYAAKFPAGKLREEALVLRIEALHASGDQSAADALGQRLLRESPSTPYAARVRAALVEPLRK